MDKYTIIEGALGVALLVWVLLPDYIRNRERKALGQVRGFLIYRTPSPEQHQKLLLPINYARKDDRAADCNVSFDQQADKLHFILPKAVIPITAQVITEDGNNWSVAYLRLSRSADNRTWCGVELNGARKVLLVDTFSKGVIATIVIDDTTK